MAKVKSSGLRNYVGRLGGSVYYMLKGQNVARELAPSVSNPKTALQMGVRTALGNLVALYRTNRAWMERYAFPERPSNQSVYNAFVSANLGKTAAVHLTKDQVAQQYAVLAPLTFTKGTLGDVYCEWNGEDEMFDIETIRFGAGSNTTFTMGAYAKSLIDGSNGLLQNGDQISLVLMCQLDQGRVVVSAVEYTLNVDDDVVIGDITEGNTEHPAGKFLSVAGGNYATNGALQPAVDALLDWGITIQADEIVLYGMVCVVSRKDANGRVRVTTSHLGLSDVSYLLQFTSAAAKNAAARSYGSDLSLPFLSPGYDGEQAVVANRFILSVESSSSLTSSISINGSEYNVPASGATPLRVAIPQGEQVTIEAVENPIVATRGIVVEQGGSQGNHGLPYSFTPTADAKVIVIFEGDDQVE